ncbi:MAG: ribonuclease HI [Christensenellales bacterium]
MKKVVLYTDGACSNNPGVGGWGAILMYGEHKKEMSGAEKLTTNNKMELEAVIQGLSALKEPCQVSVYSDSAYVVNAFICEWVDDWQNNGWRTAGKKDVQNVEQWKKLIELSKIHQIEWNKVKGHADNEYNNRCDYLARHAIETFRE